MPHSCDEVVVVVVVLRVVVVLLRNVVVGGGGGVVVAGAVVLDVGCGVVVVVVVVVVDVVGGVVDVNNTLGEVEDWMVVDMTPLIELDVKDGVVVEVSELGTDDDRTLLVVVAKVEVEVPVVERRALVDAACDGVVVVETVPSTADTPFALVVVELIVLLKSKDAPVLIDDDALVRHGQVYCVSINVCVMVTSASQSCNVHTSSASKVKDRYMVTLPKDQEYTILHKPENKMRRMSPTTSA